MTAPSPARLRAALDAAGITFTLEPGWDNPNIAGTGEWDPHGVLMHHTAGRNSLSWIMSGLYGGRVRLANFLVTRTGHVHVVSAFKAYHGGAGGPLRLGSRMVPQDYANARTYGIELESLGRRKKARKPDDGDGITKEQGDAAARLAAALVLMLGESEKAVANHRTWAPRRKTDTRRGVKWWRKRVRAAIRVPEAGKKPKRDRVEFVKESRGWGKPGKPKTRTKKARKQVGDRMTVYERRTVRGKRYVRGPGKSGKGARLWYRAGRTRRI